MSNDQSQISFFLTAYFSREELAALLADAYHDGASEDEPMLPLADALENFRQKALGNTNIIPLLLHLSAEIGRSRRPVSRKIFVGIREWVYQKLESVIWKKLALKREMNDTNFWQNAFAEALAYWEIRLCQILLNAREAVGQDSPEYPFDLAKQLDLVIQENWINTYPLYNYFGHQPSIPGHLRGRLLIPAGQILLYFLHEPDLALATFQEADRLLPHNGRIQAAFSEFHIHQKSFQEATDFAYKALELTPNEGEGYVFLGDIDEQAGQFEEAQKWFETAIEKEPEGTLAYTRLMRLLSRPDQIDQNEERIIRLAERAIDIEPHSHYVLLIEIAFAFQNGKQFDKAIQWLDKAIELAPQRITGYLNQGYVYYDKASDYLDDHNDLSDAEFLRITELIEEHFSQALAIDPESYEPYWALGLLCELKQDWASALDWYSKIPQLPWFKNSLQDHPHARAPFINQIGKIQRQLGRLEEAEATFYQGLRLDRRGDGEILSLADSLSEEQDTFSKALEIYAVVRRIKGESFEASYQNRLGNAYYYHSDYRSAVSYYTSAIDHNPNEPIYHTNLAGAYRHLQEWEKAREALRAAFDLDGLENRLHRELALIYNEEGNAHFQEVNYPAALECYARAIELNDQEPVYFSNFALGCERMIPDRKSTVIQNAVWALEKALELKPQSSDYHRRLEKLRAYQSISAVWGDSCFKALLNPPIFGLTFSKNLASTVFVSDQELLQEDYESNIDSIYYWCRDAYGLNISIKTFIDETQDDENRFWITLNGTPVASETIPGNFYLFVGDPAPLNEKGIETLETVNPFNGQTAYFISGEDASAAREAGFYLWTPPGYGALNLARQIEENLAQALTITEMARLLESTNDDACLQIAGSPADLLNFTLIGKALVDELAPLLDLPACAAEFLRQQKNGITSKTSLLAAIRQVPSMLERLAGNAPQSIYIAVDPLLEEQLELRIETGPNEPFLALTPEFTQHLLAIIRNHINTHVNGSAALVVNDPIRRIFLRQLVKLEFPYLWVLARAEVIAPVVNGEKADREWGPDLAWQEMES